MSFPLIGYKYVKMLVLKQYAPPILRIKDQKVLTILEQTSHYLQFSFC